MVRKLLLWGLLCGFAAAAAAVEKNQPAPDFSGAALRGGEPVRAADFHGKVLLVDFWASWCAPCRQALPHYQALRQEFTARGFEVIGVDVDEQSRDGVNALKTLQLAFPLVADPKGTIAAAYDVQVMPSSYVVDRKGVVRSINHGFNDDDVPRLRQTIAALLEEK